MRVTIMFPDGSKKTYYVDVKGAKSVEEICDRLLEVMKQDAKYYWKDVDKWAKGVRHWLLPHLTGKLLEHFYKEVK
ncbi:MAG: hypothetical protein QXT14_08940 [Candidatus Bathyarchaeia archaeon]